ncbi:unnamed protein product [Bursaphelenchus xylophilus]|uniref:(pine wood nematode) hypothetical protein n=1 Tax=Bursaphelenchus xylophilus TaxID=6326 RepID=A0A1I7RP34_BURXY|nr:unnamed protein product [Bursaphelenchus xylophilus]CAG9124505.1 unnamed protein product [Bursaphelenchus xylophilus]
MSIFTRLEKKKRPAMMNQMAQNCLQAFRQVLVEVSPTNVVKKALILNGDVLRVRNCTYQLNNNVKLVGVGKAAHDMIVGAEHVLGGHVQEGIAAVPIGTKVSPGLKTRFLQGAKDNLPDQASLDNTQEIIKFIENCDHKADKIFLFLISGGASALLSAPVAGITLEDKYQTIRLMASHGLDIKEMNTVRIALSEVKGGGLARKLGPAKGISLIMSDIVGGEIDKVGSGPTVLQSRNLTEAARILDTRGLWDQLPSTVREALQKPEKILSDDGIQIQNELISDNQLLLQSIKSNLEGQGIPTVIVNHALEGNAKNVGEKFAEFVEKWDNGNEIKPPFGQFNLKIQPGGASLALLYGGETTVSFPKILEKENPKGGRNQEMVLAFLYYLKKSKMLQEKRFVFMSLGSDGQDGPTDATGAYICSEDITAEGCDEDEIEFCLDNKNSYEFWSNFLGGDRLVKTGKTGNNLMDVQLLILA